jgi:AcrR family transcriptional regulator
MTRNRRAAPRRDRRVERTKRLLTEALMELVRERDYDDITVQDILDRADIGRSTFYAHFRNKDQLLLGDFGRGLAPQPWPTGSFDLFAHLAESYGLFRSLAGTEGLPAAMDRLRRSVADAWGERLDAIEPQDGGAPVAPEVAERFLTGALMSVVEWWLEAGMPYPPERMNEMLSLLATASLAAAGLRNVNRETSPPTTGRSKDRG